MRQFLLGLFLLCACGLTAQRVLLVEKLNKAQTTKLYVGDYIQYRVVGDNDWYGDRLYDLREDVQALVFPDRYVPITDIRTIREGRANVKNMGLLLVLFGVSWSTFAAVGTATDGDSETSYRWSDAAVTGASVGTGLLLPALFGTHTMRFGQNERLRLRIIDISF